MHRGCTPKPCVFLGPTVQVLSEFLGFDVVIFIFVSVAGIHFIDHKLRYTKWYFLYISPIQKKSNLVIYKKTQLLQ